MTYGMGGYGSGGYGYVDQSGQASITGTLSATESNQDSFTASGNILVQGALAAVENGSDSFSGSGSVSSGASLYLLHHIDSSIDGALTDYQIPITVNKGFGTNSGNTCYINCAADFSDVQFKSADGSALLSFWKETPITATSAKFWVKIPSIPASGGVDIRLYFTGIATTSTQNGSTTFPSLFDDFINSNVRTTHIAMDSAQIGGFDPVSRRIYNLSGENGDGSALKLGQWLNIDTNETGIIWPGNQQGLQGQSVIYHSPSGKFYLYGGYDGYANTPYSTAICTYDPATDTWATLTETLTTAIGGSHYCVYDSVSNKVYIFGGSTAIVSSPRSYTNLIQVHDLTAGTVTNTGAVLANPSWGHAPQVHGRYVFLFGGAGVNAGSNVSYNTIYKYNLDSPSSNPTLVSTATLSQRRDTAMTAKVGNSVYVFGGYDYNTATYWKSIDKFDLTSETLTTLSATMFYEDDDALCFYDSVKDRVFIGPVRHSTTTAHADDKKRYFIEFNPNTETFAIEPSVPSVPGGWTSNGTSTTDTLDAINGSYMSLADNSATTYLRAEKNIGSSLTGKFFMEFGVSVWGRTINNTAPSPNTQIRIKKTGTDFSLDPLITLRAAKTTAPKSDSIWTVESPTGTQTTIAAIPKGQHVVSAKIDTAAQTVISSVNRGAGVSKSYQNAGVACQQIWINTPSTNVEGALFDWVLVRKWTTNEPANGSWTAFGNSGFLAATESGSDTFQAFSSNERIGTLNAVEVGNDSFIGAGNVFIQGILSTNETDIDTFTSSGNVKIQGVFNAIESGDTFLSTGKVYISGILNATETTQDTFLGSYAALIIGSLNATESNVDEFYAKSPVKINQWNYLMDRNQPLSKAIDNKQVICSELPDNITHIAFFEGKLFVATQYAGHAFIYFSQDYWWHLYNTKQDYLTLEGRVVSMKAVPQGLVIGTETQIWVYAQDLLAKIADYGLVEGSSIAIDSENNVLAWTTRGICSLFPFQNITNERYSFKPGSHVSTAIVNQDGNKRMMILTNDEGAAYNAF